MSEVKGVKSTAGFTLVELLISIVLIGIVMLAVVALDVSTRNFLTSAEYESRVQNEISPVLEKIIKDAAAGIGSKNNPGVVVTAGNIVKIRHIDINSPPTYGYYSDDPEIMYGFISNQITTQTRASASVTWSAAEVLAENIVNCQFSLSAALPELNLLSITATARRDATLAVSRKNPEVRLETSVFARSQSIN